MRATPPASPGAGGVYLHFPFCSVRCSYCDFPTVAGKDDAIEAYLDALEREVRWFQTGLSGPVDSVYLGGGTPSRMRPQQVERVLEVVRSRYRVEPGSEVTLECNPESVDATKLSGFLKAGVTRVSIGVQSLSDAVLRAVGRAHDGEQALEALRTARAIGGLEVGVDLIAGLPGEDLASWHRSVRRVTELEPDHVSVYLLELDKDTPLARAVRHGRVTAAADDALAAAYRRTVEVLGARGYELYEISNFARDGRVSRHNEKYWTDVSYAGFGLGAHAYFEGERRANRRDLPGYLDDLVHGRDPLERRDPWNPRRRVEEALILGLRRSGGVNLDRLGRRYGANLVEDYAAAWIRGEEAGLLERDGPRVRLTGKGRLVSNELFAELIDDRE